MTEFSLQECAKRLGITDKSDADCAKELYMNLDKMILYHRNYLKSCVFDWVRNKISEVDREVWGGILFGALKMAIESELGGAVKRGNLTILDFLFDEDAENQSDFNVEWAGTGVGMYCNPIMLTEQQKQAERQKIQEGIDNDDRRAYDCKLGFEVYCDMINLDSARLSPKTCYLIGSQICLEKAMEDDKVGALFAEAFDMYSQMMPSQRLNDFNHLCQKIQEINQSDPFAIMISHWKQHGGDNQGNGHTRD